MNRCTPGDNNCRSGAGSKVLAAGAVASGAGALVARAKSKSLDRAAGKLHSLQMRVGKRRRAYSAKHGVENTVGSTLGPQHSKAFAGFAKRENRLFEGKHATLNSAIKWKKGAKVAGAAALGLGVAAGLKHAYDKRRDSLWASGFEHESAESL